MRALFEGDVLQPQQKKELESLVSIPDAVKIPGTSEKYPLAFGLGLGQKTAKPIGRYWFYLGFDHRVSSAVRVLARFRVDHLRVHQFSDCKRPEHPRQQVDGNALRNAKEVWRGIVPRPNPHLTDSCFQGRCREFLAMAAARATLV